MQDSTAPKKKVVGFTPSADATTTTTTTTTSTDSLSQPIPILSTTNTRFLYSNNNNNNNTSSSLTPHSYSPSSSTILSPSALSTSLSTSVNERQWVFEPGSTAKRRSSNEKKQKPTVITTAKGKLIQPQQTNQPQQKISSKEMTKAQRRVLQESQRAAKAAQREANGLPANKKQGGQPSKNAAEHSRTSELSINTVVGGNSPALNSATPTTSVQITPNSTTLVSASQGDPVTANPTLPLGLNTVYSSQSVKPVPLFSHLITDPKPPIQSLASIHPCIRTLALKFSSYSITGANARCIAMLTAFKKVISDYKTPMGHTLCRHLPTHLSPQISFLVGSRPMSVGMGNAVRVLKYEISKLGMETSEENAKEEILQFIDEFIRDRIVFADQVIADHAMEKIHDGDVLLVYTHSSVVEKLLLQAFDAGCKFKVIVVDARPKLEGKQFLRTLCDAGIQCTYTLLNAVGYVMKDVTKVFLGANAFLSNGALLSRCGTALVALTAHCRRVPVIVLCETYKFSEKVQLDSFVWNEIANPDELIKTFTSHDGREVTPLKNWQNVKDLKLLNLLYDVTPSEYIDVVVTETGMIPCTSVPVVMREYKPMVRQ